MASTDSSRRKRDPLPNEFESEDMAAAFWDTHSVAAYEEFLEPADIQVNSPRRHYAIEIDEEAFKALRTAAARKHKNMGKLAGEILKKRLAAA